MKSEHIRSVSPKRLPLGHLKTRSVLEPAEERVVEENTQSETEVTHLDSPVKEREDREMARSR